jgi:hypothetical protein
MKIAAGYDHITSAIRAAMIGRDSHPDCFKKGLHGTDGRSYFISPGTCAGDSA